jgi:hypothetical protein
MMKGDRGTFSNSVVGAGEGYENTALGVTGIDETVESVDGTVDGTADGTVDGTQDGRSDGKIDGVIDGAPEVEGSRARVEASTMTAAVKEGNEVGSESRNSERGALASDG